MIDLHAHILPAIDDGPRDADESVALCKALVADGVACAVATPHMPNRSNLGPDAFFESADHLRPLLMANGVSLDLHVAAEFSLACALDAHPVTLEALAIGGLYILTEPPLGDDWGAIALAHQRLASLGLRMLLAHAERFTPLQQSTDELALLVQSGVLVQVTAPAVSGSRGKTEKRAADKLLREGLAHCVATDAHGATRRPPQLAAAHSALRRSRGLAEADWLTRDSPASILRGDATVTARAAQPASGTQHTRWRRALSRTVAR